MRQEKLAAGFVRQYGTRSIAQGLREQRKRAGLSQGELCSRIGADRRTYSNWEAARYWPNSYWLPLIAEALGCTIEDLFLPEDPEGMEAK